MLGSAQNYYFTFSGYFALLYCICVLEYAANSVFQSCILPVLRSRISFYAAQAPGENFDAALAPAPAPTLLYSKAKFLKRTEVYIYVETILFK
jgi:hypothetical protein